MSNGVSFWKRVRLLKPIEHPSWWTKTIEFIEQIRLLPRQAGEVLPQWRVFPDRDAAHRTFGSVARKFMTREQFHPDRLVLYCLVLQEVRNQIDRFGLDPARQAGHDLKEEAVILATCLMNQDREPGLLSRALERWAVWQAGYGLYADLDGKLIVYRYDIPHELDSPYCAALSRY